MKTLRVKPQPTIKNGAEKKFINKNNTGKIFVGTINKRKGDCKAVYVQLETWITVEESLYSSIAAIRRRFRANLYQVSNIYFDGLKSTMCDYDYNITEIHDVPYKTSFLKIEVTLLSESSHNWDDDFIFAGRQFGETLYELMETLDDHFIMNLTSKG